MSDIPTIYHNARCSKSRATLQILEQLDTEYKIVNYLENPPNFNNLSEIIKMLSIAPRELMRKGQSEYKEHHLDDPSLTDKQLIEAMCQFPILIERPIVVHNGQAVIGRPPENVRSIL